MPDPIDLTDLEAVRVFLQKEDIATGQDDVIQSLITAASRAIRERFQREFVIDPSAPVNTRRFIFDMAEGRLDLEPYDLQTVATVKLDPQDAGGTTLTQWSDFIVQPEPKRHGVYTSIKLLPPILVQSNWRRGTTRVLDITGTWGFPAIPQDVAHWTRVVVAAWLRKDVAAFSSVFKIDEGQVERASMLPGGAVAGLRHYERSI